MKTIQRQSPMRTRCSLLLWPISLLTGGWGATNCLFDRLYEVDEIKCKLLFSARLPRLKRSTHPVSKKWCAIYCNSPAFCLLKCHMQRKPNISFLASPAILSQPGTAKKVVGSFTPALNKMFLVRTAAQQTTSCCTAIGHASQSVTLGQLMLATIGEGRVFIRLENV